MNSFLKPKILLWVIALLLVANVATFIGVVIAHTDKEDSPEKQRNLFFKKLGLTENQKKNFIARKAHFKAINEPLYNRYDSIMIQLHYQVGNTSPDTATIRMYTDSLGLLNAQIRRNWLAYSIEVRKCLNKEQQARYDKLTLEHLKCKMGK
jgi:Spy/CpxP family protein refolding chaperone